MTTREVERFLVAIDHIVGNTESPQSRITQDMNSSPPTKELKFYVNEPATDTNQSPIKTNEGMDEGSSQKVLHYTPIKNLKWVTMQKTRKKARLWTPNEQELFHQAYVKLKQASPVSPFQLLQAYSLESKTEANLHRDRESYT